MSRFGYKDKRYRVQAKKKADKKWTDWAIVDDYDDAVKHFNRVKELGYSSRIIDKENR